MRGLLNLLIIILLVFFAQACTKKAEPHHAPSAPRKLLHDFSDPYNASRTIVDVFEKKLTPGGVVSYVILSLDSAIHSTGNNKKLFDRFEIFQFDSTQKKYRSIFVDVMEFGKSVEFKDLTNDAVKEIIITRVNDSSTDARLDGLYVYGVISESEVNLLFYNDEENPQFADLDADKTLEILLEGRYQGMLDDGDEIRYTKDVYWFDGEVFAANNTAFGEYYAKNIQRVKKQYEALKKRILRRKNVEDIALYRAFISWILWISASGSQIRVEHAWRTESDFLMQYLTDEQYGDVLELIEGYETPEENVDEYKKQNV